MVGDVPLGFLRMFFFFCFCLLLDGLVGFLLLCWREETCTTIGVYAMGRDVDRGSAAVRYFTFSGVLIRKEK